MSLDLIDQWSEFKAVEFWQPTNHNINDIVQYTCGFPPLHFTVYPSPYSCITRWYYYRHFSTILVTIYYSVYVLL